MSATAFQRMRREAAQKPSAPEPITREDIADMKKADVVDLLKMHGASTKGNRPELRERLIEVMFVNA